MICVDYGVEREVEVFQLLKQLLPDNGLNNTKNNKKTNEQMFNNGT